MLREDAEALIGVERGAEFMAHIGEELRLVLARLGELAALLLDFIKQPYIFNRDCTKVDTSSTSLSLTVSSARAVTCSP
jgi:hypothetical protein